MRTIGILALQGDFQKHENSLVKLGIKTIYVKKVEDLKPCDGLIIPGGESTAMTRLMNLYGFYDAINEFSSKYPIMGTCAGMIMLSKTADCQKVSTLGLIDICTGRNAYGRQIDSFRASLNVSNLGYVDSFIGYFIRAPKILSMGREVRNLVSYNDCPVMVSENNILALSFHPELSDDKRIHKYFIDNY